MDDSAPRDIVDEIGRLAGEVDPEVAAAGYRQAVRDAYWKAKDLGAVTSYASAGYAYCLSASATAEGEAAHRLRSEAKALMYDLASFTWPGWGEPGVAVLERDLRIGLEAAIANLRLAGELDKGDLPRSRALWMLGAHLLVADRYSEAGERFSEGAVLAASAENSAEARLGEAFAALASLLDGGPRAQQHFDDTIARVAAEDDGAALVEQVATAREVFTPSRLR